MIDLFHKDKLVCFLGNILVSRKIQICLQKSFSAFGAIILALIKKKNFAHKSFLWRNWSIIPDVGEMEILCFEIFYEIIPSFNKIGKRRFEELSI